jgi:ABC-2 type transport system permease protein
MTTLTIDDNIAYGITRTKRPSMARLVKVETRKAIDTRAGKWLLGVTLVGGLVAATIALFAVNKSGLTFDDFFSNVSNLQSVLLPVIGVLLVTSEWGQRTALTTFTLEPNRIRIIVAKFIASVLLTAAVLVFAFVASVAGAAAAGPVRGTKNVWNLNLGHIAEVSLNQLLSTIQGVAFGALILISAAAIVAIFALPTVMGILGSLLPGTADTLKWINPGQTSMNLSDHTMGGDAWAQFATSSLLFIVLPILIGVWRLVRAEVK